MLLDQQVTLYGLVSGCLSMLQAERESETLNWMAMNVVKVSLNEEERFIKACTLAYSVL